MFLWHYHLVVNAICRQLVDTRCMQPSQLPPSLRGGRDAAAFLVHQWHTTTLPPAAEFEFQDGLNPSSKLPPTTYGVEHHLRTSGRLVTAKFRCLDLAMHAVAKAAFKEMERPWVVRRLCSCWASTLHRVKKQMGHGGHEPISGD
jgi:hypothetical protein